MKNGTIDEAGHVNTDRDEGAKTGLAQRIKQLKQGFKEMGAFLEGTEAKLARDDFEGVEMDMADLRRRLDTQKTHVAQTGATAQDLRKALPLAEEILPFAEEIKEELPLAELYEEKPVTRTRLNRAESALAMAALGLGAAAGAHAIGNMDPSVPAEPSANHIRKMDPDSLKPVPQKPSWTQKVENNQKPSDNQPPLP